MKEKIKQEDIEILKFLSKYKLLKVEDARLIYKTKRYYRQDINRLIANGYIKKYKSYIVLDKNGRKKLNKQERVSYIKNMQNSSYMERLKNIARIATITINSNIIFIPSWEIKDKKIYTETARKYLGKIIMNEKEYLVYYISSKKENVYIKQLLFDINKSFNYNEIIIFVDDLNVINKKYYNLSFGKNNTYIILNNDLNKRILKNYNNLNIHDIIENLYEKEILISNWQLADYYILEDDLYIVNMFFINTEKIEKINWFYKENVESNRKIEIVTIRDNKEVIEKMVTTKCKIIAIDNEMIGGNK